MASKKLMDKLNKAIAREIQVSIQYMWQHVMAFGINSPGVKGMFKEIAITEMKHAEEIAERLSLLGGIPTTHPSKITVGKTLTDMIKLDVKAEEEAIEMYKEIIKLAAAEDDTTTRRLMEKILEDEEGHLDEFSSLLQKR